MFSPQNTRAVYINLRESTARRAEIEAQLKPVEPLLGKAERFEATRHREGWRGCALSHVGVLRQALSSYAPEVEYLAVFEDDFIWRCDTQKAMTILSRVRTPFDVLMLAYAVWVVGMGALSCVDGDPHVLRLTDRGYWTAGFIVHRSFWATLEATWSSATEAIDKAWQPLQAQHRFFYIAPVLGNQSAAPSTIQSYTSRTFGNKLDMTLAVVLLDSVPSGTSLDIVRRMCHTVVENVPMRNRSAIVRRLLACDNDVVVCINGPVSFGQIMVALHNVWQKGGRVVLLSPHKTFIDPPTF